MSICAASRFVRLGRLKRVSTSFIQDHPSLLEKTRAFDQEVSPFEPLYGSGELAAAIAAGVVLNSES